MKNRVIIIFSLLFIVLVFFTHDQWFTSKSFLNQFNLLDKKKLIGYSIEQIWDLDIQKYSRGFAIDSQDNMYVSEAYEGSGTNTRILKYNKSGVFLGWLGKGNKTTGWHTPDSTEKSIAGHGDGEFYNIFKITFDDKDNMYVLDRGYFDKNGIEQPGNDRVQKFDSQGNFLGWLGKGNKTTGWHLPKSGEISVPYSNEDGAINKPTGICINGNDLLVTSWTLNKLDQFDLSTGVLKQWLGKAQDGSLGWHSPGSGEPKAAVYYGHEPGAFNGAFDCKFDSKGRLYVLSYNSDPVIAIFDYTSGKYMDGLFHSAGYKPANIILDKYDNLIMSDNYQGSVRFLNFEKEQVASLQLGPGGDYFAIGDFAFDSQNYFYFLEKVKNKIYKLKLNY